MEEKGKRGENRRGKENRGLKLETVDFFID
jgi:hypothetical protein